MKFEIKGNLFSQSLWPLLFVLILFALTPSLYAQNCSLNAGVNQTICADQALSLVGIKAGLSPNTTIWSQVLGTPASISSPNALTTNITGFGVGSYRFRLSLTCQDGVTVFDDVDITVIPAISVNAGPDITKCKQAAPVGTVVTLAAQPVSPGQTAGLLGSEKKLYICGSIVKYYGINKIIF